MLCCRELLVYGLMTSKKEKIQKKIKNKGMETCSKRRYGHRCHVRCYEIDWRSRIIYVEESYVVLDKPADALDKTSLLLEESLNSNEKQHVKLFNICHSKMEEVVQRNASGRYSLSLNLHHLLDLFLYLILINKALFPVLWFQISIAVSLLLAMFLLLRPANVVYCGGGLPGSGT
ncbi:hypothetical protein P8452_14484 [Trifolium repens]|nr:hypothetical protein P8452_14484 [Trifolium repens]